MVSGHGDVCSDTHEMFLRLKESRDYIEALRKSALSEADLLQDTLWERYDFRGVQESYHRNNLELMKKEITDSRSSVLEAEEV